MESGQCGLCGNLFNIRKRYHKCSIASKLRSGEQTAKEVLCDLGVSFTPKSNPCICLQCRDKIGKLQTTRKQCSESLTAIKKSAKTETYIGGKLLQHNPPTPSPRKIKRRMVSTPVKRISLHDKQESPSYLGQHNRKSSAFLKLKSITVTAYLSRAANLICTSKHYTAMRLLLRSSKAYRQAFRRIVADTVRVEMKNLCSPRHNSILRTAENVYTKFTSFHWGAVIREAKSICPTLLSALKAASSPLKNNSGQPIPYVGSTLCQLAYANKPSKMKVFQQMVGTQLWLSGCSREAFSRFNHLGISVGIGAVRACIDRVRAGFDKELQQQKLELMQPRVRKQLFVAGPNEHDLDESIRLLDAVDIVENEPQPVVDDQLGNRMDFTDDTEERLLSLDSLGAQQHFDTLDDDDVVETDLDSELDETFQYTEAETPHAMCYSLVFDNVNQKTHARYSTRQNQMYNMVQAYAAIDRIPSMQEPDYMPNADVLRNIPVNSYFPSPEDEVHLRSEYEVLIQRILTKHIKCFQSLRDSVLDHIPHQYSHESMKKSKLIPLGVLHKDESKIVDMIDILVDYSKYVPTKTDGSPMNILLYGDGLSCERVNDAQNARITADNALDRLEVFIPAIQEWHKRGVLLEDTYRLLYNSKSARASGTLYNIRNVYGHKNVERRVMHCFNHATDLLRFATEAYVVAAACNAMGLESPHAVPENFPADELEQWTYFSNICEDVTHIAFQPVKVSENEAERFCYCNGEEDGDMVKCDNSRCPKGLWFHLDCLHINVMDLPDGDWFCCEECRLSVIRHPDDYTDKDHRYEYTKTLLWRGIGEMVRHDAVRENDGERILRHWKYDMIEFYDQHHPKYFVCGHRLLTDVNGGSSERIAHQLKWNRTVNYKGGKGNNLEMDLQMEFFNRSYKEAVKDAGGNLTKDTIARHSQMVGLSKDLAKIFQKQVSCIKDFKKARTEVNRDAHIVSLATKLLGIKAFSVIPGRFHHGFEIYEHNCEFKHKEGMVNRLIKHTNKLAARLEMMAN